MLINVDGNCKCYAASNLPRRHVMIDYLLFCRAGAELVMSCCRWSLVKKTLQFRAITLHWVKVTARSAATCCSVRPYPRLNQSQAFATHDEQSFHSRCILAQTFLLLKALFINPTDAHNYKITGMLKQLEFPQLLRNVSVHSGTIIRELFRA